MLGCRTPGGCLIFVSVLMHRETNFAGGERGDNRGTKCPAPKRCWTESNSAFSFSACATRSSFPFFVHAGPQRAVCRSGCPVPGCSHIHSARHRHPTRDGWSCHASKGRANTWKAGVDAGTGSAITRSAERISRAVREMRTGSHRRHSACRDSRLAGRAARPGGTELRDDFLQDGASLLATARVCGQHRRRRGFT